ncbi:hypothetical protein B7P43_G02234 [Cryptotermes secundus]|uniref:Mos1 transposase HTH domain-containing protein n=1 Tax=Cryptotermes secundus TaxID=105785 RepID=A0A2J7PNI0_9NEOP|nr:hypothetical protein B7P43_G02234 [Cryptotermes secundus]
MEALIPTPADCEVWSVIKFLNAQSIAPIEIHRQLCRVYRPNFMSKQMACRWCRQFSAGRQSVHDEKRSGRPSIITDDLVELVRECIMENRRVTITELGSHVPQISPSLLHEIVTEHLLFRNFENDREAEIVVTQWFQSQAADFYDTGIQKLVPRYDKGLNSGGDYVEK